MDTKMIGWLRLRIRLMVVRVEVIAMQIRFSNL